MEQNFGGIKAKIEKQRSEIIEALDEAETSIKSRLSKQEKSLIKSLNEEKKSLINAIRERDEELFSETENRQKRSRLIIGGLLFVIGILTGILITMNAATILPNWSGWEHGQDESREWWIRSRTPNN